MRADGTVLMCKSAMTLVTARRVRATYCPPEQGLRTMPTRVSNGIAQTADPTFTAIAHHANIPGDTPLDFASWCAQVFAPDDGKEHAYHAVMTVDGDAYLIETGVGSVCAVVPDWTQLLIAEPDVTKWEWVLSMHTHPGGTAPSQQDKYGAWAQDEDMTACGFIGMSQYATLNMSSRSAEPYDPEQPPQSAGAIIALLPLDMPKDMLDKLINALGGEQKDGPDDGDDPADDGDDRKGDSPEGFAFD